MSQPEKNPMVHRYNLSINCWYTEILYYTVCVLISRILSVTIITSTVSPPSIEPSCLGESVELAVDTRDSRDSSKGHLCHTVE